MEGGELDNGAGCVGEQAPSPQDTERSAERVTSIPFWFFSAPTRWECLSTGYSHPPASPWALYPLGRGSSEKSDSSSSYPPVDTCFKMTESCLTWNHRSGCKIERHHSPRGSRWTYPQGVRASRGREYIPARGLLTWVPRSLHPALPNQSTLWETSSPERPGSPFCVRLINYHAQACLWIFQQNLFFGF